ncbi:hypothetical protein ZOSMA_344G00060 [Zostera marina]|uniref:Helicase C-terminal domain-containing protein n=1 Tax=Zostera marina TaxID=29655 RepID=A0A0K9P7A7_ZOSMR|nr:hypothetical protein ZOSMA_344G00060 [Zostera marina]
MGPHQLVKDCFNDFTKDEFVFLLSSKAGGCGLNLIGGNRLVLFDPDWNPANDKQAAARVWRDGQKKRVFIYRFLTTGTIEEKLYQRQMSKKGLQKVIQKEQMNLPMQQGFTLHENVRSEIHENMNYNHCERDTFAVNENSDSSEPVRNGKHIDFRVHDNDVGGFAQVSGCLQELTSSEIQNEMQDKWDMDSSNWNTESQGWGVSRLLMQLLQKMLLGMKITHSVEMWEVLIAAIGINRPKVSHLNLKGGGCQRWLIQHFQKQLLG